MDKNTIEVNFRAAMAGADELDGIANDLEKALRQGYAESMGQLARNWTGANSEFYQAKSGKLTEQIQNSVSKIRTAASELRRAAQVIHAAELAALAIAQGRDY